MDKRIYAETKNIREHIWEIETLAKILNMLSVNKTFEISQDDITVLINIITTKLKILSKIFSKHFSDVEKAIFSDCIF